MTQGPIRRASTRVAVMSNFWRSSADIPHFPQAQCKFAKKPLWDFQVHDKERSAARSRRHSRAIKICKTCDHKSECLLWGVTHEMHGVWGGKVLVPFGRRYLRCDDCDLPMIKSRYQKPPRGFRNRHTDTQCVECFTRSDKRSERKLA